MQTSCSAATASNCFGGLHRLCITLPYSSTLLKFTVQWNNCAHTLSPSQLWLTETSFSQPGGSSVFNRAPLLQNTENICRGGSSFLNVLLNAPQQLLHHLWGSIQYIFFRHSSLVRSIFIISLSNRQNFISNIFLLVKTGSGLTRALTSVGFLSLC